MPKLKPAWLVPALGATGLAIAGLAMRSSDERTVREAFRRWAEGQGSLYDLMDDDAEVVIPGVAPHCGAFSKRVFIREVATPFTARFSRPPVPRLIEIWSGDHQVVVLAEASGLRLDGKAYANRYVFILEMRRGRVVRATEFLDMTACNEVWDQLPPTPAAGGAS